VILVVGTDGKAERTKLETGKKKRPASWIPDRVVSTVPGSANQIRPFVIRDFSGNEISSDFHRVQFRILHGIESSTVKRVLLFDISHSC
jgi:hypothetical protein